MKLSHACWVALLIACASGCNTVALVDNLDLELDFNPFDGPSDALHAPYVQGAGMNIWVLNTDGRVKTTRWTLESTDPSVFFVDQQFHVKDDFYASCRALKAGLATLVVRDENGDRVHSHPIEVALPDRVDLLAHGLLLIGRPEPEARIAEARIRATGTATYLARYWRGQERLNGNGALSVEAPPEVTGHVERSFLFEDRDWLQLTPLAPGTSTVAIKVGGEKIRDLQVVAVPDSELVRVELLGEDESAARAEQWLVVLAQAYDALDRPVYGVEYKWALDGASQLGLGDLYRYHYNPNRPGMLTARFGDMAALVPIHGVGFVDSTNRIGCAAVPGAPARTTLGWLLLAALALPLVRRRRRA